MVKRTLISSMLVMIVAILFAGATVVTSAGEEVTYRLFVTALNRGDVASAVALMTEDVQLQGTPGCLTAPCIGKQAVRADLEQHAAGHLYIQLLGSVSVSNNTLRANTAHRADFLASAGLSRVIINETISFQGDKISRIVFDPEVSDPQTAQLLKILMSGPSAPQPTAPLPAVRPPATGDGGLLDAHKAA